MAGDANRDGNTYNDRLPGEVRNTYVGPGYFTTDVRVSKEFQLSGARASHFAGRVVQRDQSREPASR